MAVHGSEELGAAVAGADAVIVAAGHEAGRPPLIGAEVLGQMRADAVLVNVGRGALVDEIALLAALDRGAIVGAGLDVFATEPTTAAESELVDHERVIATAHTAALTTAYFERGAEALAEALTALVEGRRPPHAVHDLDRARVTGIDLTARPVTKLGASTQPY
jgi:phosphoglycerate dehydrogenase-like enzyme